MITEKMYAELDHAKRGPMTVILGEIELVLSDTDVPAEKRRQSQGILVEVVRKMEQMLVQRRDGGPRR
jgi:hypothetical protein